MIASAAMADANALRATVEAYVEGWRTRDRELWSSLFAEDATLTDPVGTEPMVGKDACVGFFDKVQAMPFRFVPKVHRIAVCGGEALLAFRMEATDENGNGYFVETTDLFTFDEQARIRSLRAYWDKGCQGRIKGGAAVG